MGGFVCEYRHDQSTPLRKHKFIYGKEVHERAFNRVPEHREKEQDSMVARDTNKSCGQAS